MSTFSGFNGTFTDISTNIDFGAVITHNAATVGVNGSDLVNPAARGVRVVLDITAITAGSIVVTIQGKDTASGKYYDILASAAKTTTGTTVLTVYPSGIAAVANVTAVDSLPQDWRIKTTISTGPVTATVGASLLS